MAPIRLILAAAGLLIATGAMAEPGGPAQPSETSKSDKAKRSPSDWVCENQEVLGSRLARKRVCATRAEWADRKSRERDIIDRSQTQLCVPDPATGKCG